ncbi:MAG: PEFG-CTERM sorting domain-containing protein [Cenarchaeum symbiont of Oopsacas minuta]|nr:PEFG-CTERM sorting domain-containing protein [Cenarchaeum symbiont of Oopsacas minuta]
MNIKTISTLFVLFSLVSGVMATQAYGDHSKAYVSIPTETSIPGCETTNMCFIPYDVSVDKGGQVIWTNDDIAAHTVTSGTPSDSVGDIFDSSLMSPGSTFSHKFEVSGTFDYFCIVHPWMDGIVTVAAQPEDEHGHMDVEPAMMMSQDGNYTVKVYPDGIPTAGEMFSLKVVVTDSDDNTVNHINYDIMIMQDGESVMDDGMGVHAHDGMKEHMTTMLESDSPIDVLVTLQGIGLNDIDTRVGPIGETIELNVVPEFGTIAILVFAVAIISIIAVTTRSRISLTPKL